MSNQLHTLPSPPFFLGTCYPRGCTKNGTWLRVAFFFPFFVSPQKLHMSSKTRNQTGPIILFFYFLLSSPLTTTTTATIVINTKYGFWPLMGKDHKGRFQQTKVINES